MVVARHQPQSEISTQSTPPALREPQPRLAQARTLRPTAISLRPSFIFQFGHWSVSHDIFNPLRGGTPTAIMQAERRGILARRPAVSRSAVLHWRRTPQADLLRQADSR